MEFKDIKYTIDPKFLHSLFPKLTYRQAEVLSYRLSGVKDKKTQNILNISRECIKSHRFYACEKYGVDNAWEFFALLIHKRDELKDKKNRDKIKDIVKGTFDMFNDLINEADSNAKSTKTGDKCP